ncbi:DUF6892 domain-containing protein [Streptomyces sp. NPDC048512]|uniref:DUF6892 domain-containing protein n=1 Tax=Streptomyces sp. NPDC048512 TaxID=3365563 RepID=UPI00370FF92B
MADLQAFNLKLLVIEKLMYTDGTLTPRFRLADLLRARGLGDGPWTYAYEQRPSPQMVPEARVHFESLEIDDELLATVDELVVDGGLRVYQECAPVRDGEDDLFDVVPSPDLDLLPGSPAWSARLRSRRVAPRAGRAVCRHRLRIRRRIVPAGTAPSVRARPVADSRRQETVGRGLLSHTHSPVVGGAVP